MEPLTRRLEVDKNLTRSEKGVICLGPIELPDPYVFYHAKDKFTSPALRGFEGCVIAASGLVYRLLSGAERRLLIAVY